MIRSPSKTIHLCKDIPNEPHYVALVETSFNESDDYGGTNSSTTLNYVMVGNEEQLKAWILDADTPRYGPLKVYKIIKVTPVSITKHVEVFVA